MPVYMSK